MAIVADGFKGTLTLVDNGRNSTTKTYMLKAANITDALADMADIVAAFSGVSGAAVVGYTVQAQFIENALNLPASGVQLEDTALITCSIVGEPLKSATISIPAPKPAIFVGLSDEDSNIVNTASAAVDAYFSVFQLNGQAYISDGESALNMRKGRRVHRGSRRG